jgi:hypothetical protein
MGKAIRLADDVRDALKSAVVEGNILRLTGQLERALYDRTNKALEALGGKWNRHKKGHVFDGDPRTAIEAASETGKVAHPNPLDFFWTSREVAEMACHRLGMGDGWKRTMEPSAGEGHLILPLVDWFGMPTTDQLSLVEMDPKRCLALGRAGLDPYVTQSDFLALDPMAIHPFARILMNPPFGRGNDVKHIDHALNFLAPSGRLVAIASAALSGRGDTATAALRANIEAWGGSIDPLPEGSFKHAGTSVATVMVVVDRPRSEGLR